MSIAKQLQDHNFRGFSYFPLSSGEKFTENSALLKILKINEPSYTLRQFYHLLTRTSARYRQFLSRAFIFAAGCPEQSSSRDFTEV